nr:chemotaxis protein CheW [Thiorhodococcus mannitoliphagus]
MLFETAGTSYLTRLDALDEVLMPVELERLAGAPPFLRGVMSLRGEVLPVIALGERLGAGDPGPWRRSSRILKVRVGQRPLGFIIDAIGRIQALDAGAVQAPILAETTDNRFLGPLWRIDGHLVQEIRLDAVLDDEALLQLHAHPLQLPR